MSGDPSLDHTENFLEFKRIVTNVENILEFKRIVTNVTIAHVTIAHEDDDEGSDEEEETTE